jgi:hypothetical protein
MKMRARANQGEHDEQGGEAPIADSVRRPTFTVGSAMRWLGHDCPERLCWSPFGELDATVWFLLSDRRSPVFPPKTRVIVDLSIAGVELSRVHRIINEVAWCTRRDAIEVRYRRSAHSGWPIASPTPVSLLKHYRATRFDEDPDPTESDLAVERFLMAGSSKGYSDG